MSFSDPDHFCDDFDNLDYDNMDNPIPTGNPVRDEDLDGNENRDAAPVPDAPEAVPPDDHPPESLGEVLPYDGPTVEIPLSDPVEPLYDLTTLLTPQDLAALATIEPPFSMLNHVKRHNPEPRLSYARFLNDFRRTSPKKRADDAALCKLFRIKTPKSKPLLMLSKNHPYGGLELVSMVDIAKGRARVIPERIVIFVVLRVPSDYFWYVAVDRALNFWTELSFGNYALRGGAEKVNVNTFTGVHVNDKLTHIIMWDSPLQVLPLCDRAENPLEDRQGYPDELFGGGDMEDRSAAVSRRLKAVSKAERRVDAREAPRRKKPMPRDDGRQSSRDTSPPRKKSPSGKPRIIPSGRSTPLDRPVSHPHTGGKGGKGGKCPHKGPAETLGPRWDHDLIPSSPDDSPVVAEDVLDAHCYPPRVDASSLVVRLEQTPGLPSFRRFLASSREKSIQQVEGLWPINTPDEFRVHWRVTLRAICEKGDDVSVQTSTLWHLMLHHTSFGILRPEDPEEIMRRPMMMLFRHVFVSLYLVSTATLQPPDVWLTLVYPADKYTERYGDTNDRYLEDITLNKVLLIQGGRDIVWQHTHVRIRKHAFSQFAVAKLLKSVLKIGRDPDTYASPDRVIVVKEPGYAPVAWIS